MYVGVAAQAVKLAAHISGNSLGMVSFLFDCGLRGVKFLLRLPFLVEGVFILSLRRLCQRKADFGGLVGLPAPKHLPLVQPLPPNHYWILTAFLGAMIGVTFIEMLITVHTCLIAMWRQNPITLTR